MSAKRFPVFLSVQLLVLLAFATPRAEAESNRYEDLAAWAAKDVAGYAQFEKELGHVGNAPELAAVFQAAAVRQRKTTDDVIALVHVHPELRDLPTLGLDDQGLREWLESHPDGLARLNRVPAAAKEISSGMKRSLAPMIKKQSALTARVRKYTSDPQVRAAFQQLNSTLQDNRRRLLRTFS